MLAPKQEDQTQCHQLFRTRCTINNRIFGVIIDSGNCENIVRKETMKSLGLPTKKHPNPYILGWIKITADTIKVNERCKFPFFFGQYKDEVYYDVVDMDVFHLLFGRPWQYDFNA